MKKRILFYSFCICIVLNIVACKENGILKEEEIPEAKIEILKGDVDSYTRLLFYYEIEGEFESALPYSIVMAFKYNNESAYLEIYRTMIKMYNKGSFDYKLIKNLDKNSQDFAISCLKKSADLGHASSRLYLSKYYREGICLEKNIDLAEKYEKKAK